ncbi:hypothetical protein BDQ12DRAFT_750835, partial [Crucibulum laeve]
RADPSTIQDKFLVGYQGWFTCAGDGEPVDPGHHGWIHWFNYPIPDGGRPNTDLWPDVSAYSTSELYPAPGLRTSAGNAVNLFSSRNGKTVNTHFRWMAQHGVDGAFLQRFVGQTDMQTGHNQGIRHIRDEVGDHVKEAAEANGRVFAIMYDVSGVAADQIQRVIQDDWQHLLCEKGVLESASYLKENGKPVIALWGFGFDGRGHTPSLVRLITKFFRDSTPGGAYIMAGTPAHWRTAESDADRNAGFLDVWLNEVDAISPWTVGRYPTEKDADNFLETRMKGDYELLEKRREQGAKKVDYIPVVLPGGSASNLSEGQWGFNDIKRNGGRFLWRQLYNARTKLGVRIIYGAMWDEYDEGTAFMPVVPSKALLPVSNKFRFMALDEDGYDLPSDWYMRICGIAAEALHNERRICEAFPCEELVDYWSTRFKLAIDATSRPVAREVNIDVSELTPSIIAAGSREGLSFKERLVIEDAEDEPKGQ